jgi:hypothetical protein
LETRAGIPVPFLPTKDYQIEALSGNAPLFGCYFEIRGDRNEKSDKLMMNTARNEVTSSLNRPEQWAMAARFLHGTLWLVLELHAKMLIYMLEKVEITWRPLWLRRAVGESPK